MKELFSTHDVHPRDRFEYWHSVACQHLVQHDSKPECSWRFNAKMEGGNVGPVGLVLFENSPMKIARTPRQAAHASTDDLFVCRQVAGRLGLEQEARQVILEPGDITLLDPTLPYQGNFFSDSKMLVVKIPRRALHARLGKTREMVARPIKPHAAENSLASAFLAMLPAYADRLNPVAGQITGDQIVDLIAVSLAKTMECERPRHSAGKRFVSLKVHAAIEARLMDPALDAQTIADSAGVSLRYANAALAASGMSIMRLVLAKRLTRCRQALEDASHAHRTVSDIAYGWGFSDMTNFGRRFREAYGMSPSECRRRKAAR